MMANPWDNRMAEMASRPREGVAPAVLFALAAAVALLFLSTAYLIIKGAA